MKGSLEKTNIETGKETWNFQNNQFKPSEKNTFNLEKYNEEQLKKAQEKGDKKTNAESGFSNWNWDNKEKIGMTYEEIEEYKKKQLEEAQKKGGGILNTNVNSENWFGNSYSKNKNDMFIPQKYNERRLPQHIQPRKEKVIYDKEGKRIYPGDKPKEFGQYFAAYQNNNFNNQEQYNQSNFGEYFNQYKDSYMNNYGDGNNNNNNYNNNDNYNENYDERYNNYGNTYGESNYNKYEQNYNYQNNDFGNNYENYQNNNFDNTMEEGVIKVQTSEKIVEDNGMRKKIIKVTKFLQNGDTKTETYEQEI